jgi:hypothetical protein
LFGTYISNYAYAALLLQARNGTIGYAVTGWSGTSHFTSEAVAPCDGRPFTASLRVSPANGGLDLFVNGIKVLTERGWIPVGLRPQFGELNGYGFKGVLAEGLVHMGEWTDRDVLRLHAELGEQYGIEIDAVDLPTGGGVSAMAGQPVYGQWTNLAHGTYQLSWFEQETTCPAWATCPEAQLAPHIASTNGQRVAALPTGAGAIASESFERYLNEGTDGRPGWKRHFRTFALPTGGDYFVGLAVPHDPGRPGLGGGIVMAAPQLERVQGSQSEGPSAYFSTDDDYVSPIGLCEDDGTRFRTSYWGILGPAEALLPRAEVPPVAERDRVG